MGLSSEHLVPEPEIDFESGVMALPFTEMGQPLNSEEFSFES